MDDNRKIYWPDNPMYISFSVILTTGAFMLFINYLYIPMFPFPLFLMLVLTLFFYSQRIVVDDKYIAGPNAYGKRRKRVRILRTDSEAFFEKNMIGGQVVIRDKHSSKQIIVPYVYFTANTIEEFKTLLHR